MSDPTVPHPGARPREVEFPFAEARAVIAAIDAELDDLADCARAHEDGADAALGDAMGQSVGAFWQRLGTRLQDLAKQRAALAAQRDQVAGLISRASALEIERRAQITRWEQRMREHQEAQSAPGPR